MRQVRDIMSAAPVGMAPGESVSAAARAMRQHGIGTVLVLTDGRLSGLVTDRDITVRVLAENRDPRTTRIGDICGSATILHTCVYRSVDGGQAAEIDRYVGVQLHLIDSRPAQELINVGSSGSLIRSHQFANHPPE